MPAHEDHQYNELIEASGYVLFLHAFPVGDAISKVGSLRKNVPPPSGRADVRLVRLLRGRRGRVPRGARGRRALRPVILRQALRGTHRRYDGGSFRVVKARPPDVPCRLYPRSGKFVLSGPDADAAAQWVCGADLAGKVRNDVPPQDWL